MKKLSYLLIMAMFFPLVAMSATNAVPSGSPEPHRMNNTPQTVSVKDFFPHGNIPVLDSKSKSGDIFLSNSNFAAIDTITDAIWSDYWDQTPMTYEPISHTYVMVQSKRGNDVNDKFVSRTYLYTSQDGGHTWLRRMVGATGSTPVPIGSLVLNPSVAVLNTTNSSSASDLTYLISCRLYKQDIVDTTTYSYGGGAFIFVSPSPDNVDGTFLENKAPLDNNPGEGYMWSLPNMTATNGYFYSWERLNPIADSYQFGQYGFGYFNVDGTDFWSGIPAEFTSNNWLQPPTKTSTFNTDMRIDHDADGNLYAGVINLMYDPTKPHNPPMAGDSIRVPYVLKSTDKGHTWPTVVSMPQSIWDQLATSLSAYEVFAFNYFSSFDFIVTGTDSWSFAVQCVLQDTSTTNPPNLTAYTFIAEISYTDGLWKITNVNGNDLNNFGVLPVFYGWNQPWLASTSASARWTPWVLHDTSSTTDFARPIDYVMENARGFEIQMARTADYNDYVIKYIAYDGFDVSAGTSNKQMLNSDVRIDSLPYTDIFMAFRSKGNTDWQLQQITDDTQFDKITWIPKIVDISSIPIISNKNNIFLNQYHRDSTRSSYFSAGGNDGALFAQYYIETFNNTEIWCGTVDGTNPAAIQNPDKSKFPGTGVNDSQDYGSFSFNTVYPNPAKDGGEVTFNLDKRSHVTVAIYNEMGKQMNTVFEGTLDLGVYGKNFSTANLAPGAYYITITAGNHTESRLLNVVR